MEKKKKNLLRQTPNSEKETTVGYLPVADSLGLAVTKVRSYHGQS